MSGYWHAPDDYEAGPQQFSGAAHCVSGEVPDKDPAESLREVVEEVTSKSLPRPAPKSIGFY